MVFYFFQYNIDPIKRYSRQHHSSLSAVNTLLLFVSFKPAYIVFTLVIDMLALPAVLIFSIVNPFKCFDCSTCDVYVDFSTVCV